MVLGRKSIQAFRKMHSATRGFSRDLLGPTEIPSLNAVALLARRPDGKFVFVKQYRKAAEETLIEVIAGGLEKGEDPEEGIRSGTIFDSKTLSAWACCKLMK